MPRLGGLAATWQPRLTRLGGSEHIAGPRRVAGAAAPARTEGGARRGQVGWQAVQAGTGWRRLAAQFQLHAQGCSGRHEGWTPAQQKQTTGSPQHYSAVRQARLADQPGSASCLSGQPGPQGHAGETNLSRSRFSQAARALKRGTPHPVAPWRVYSVRCSRAGTAAGRPQQRALRMARCGINLAGGCRSVGGLSPEMAPPARRGSLGA